MLLFRGASVPRPTRMALVILSVNATRDGPLAECFVSLRDGKLILSKDFHFDADPNSAAGFEKTPENLAKLALSAAKRAIEDELGLDPKDVALDSLELADVAFLVADGFKIDAPKISPFTNDQNLRVALQQLRRVPEVEAKHHL
jgi:hypothetical protein